MPGQLVKDIDGNEYHTIKIGSQIWMVENLKVTHYQNGDSIKPGYEDYNDDTSISSIYGRLYDWDAVKDKRNLAPKGWHIPSDQEWITLVNYLGGASMAGGKLKEAGTLHWEDPNTGASNETGFTALPCGASSHFAPWSERFSGLGLNCIFWSSSYILHSGYDEIFTVNLLNDSPSVTLGFHVMYGEILFSVRCIKD